MSIWNKEMINQESPFVLVVFHCTAVNLWCNSAVTFNKHIAPRSASDILITLITMLLWIAFQKQSTLFIHITLCLRFPYGDVIKRFSLPLYASCINTGKCRFMSASVYKPDIYHSQNQLELTEYCITCYPGKICWIGSWTLTFERWH